MAVEEYNNFTDIRNSQSMVSNFETRNKNVVENILTNKNAIIDILSNKGTQEEKQNKLRKILEDYDSANRKIPDENRSLKDQNYPSSGMLDHAKSMGMGDESHDSLLCDDEGPNKNLKQKMESHSFHKRPLSHNNNMLRSKSSRHKRRKKTPVNDKKTQNTLISHSGVSNSKITQDVPETDPIKSKKLIDDSKFGNKKGVVNAS